MNRWTCSWALVAAVSLADGTLVAGETEVDFARDVRPLLATHCFACHGPDQRQRQADLRLDLKAGLFSTASSGEPVVEPGNRRASRLFQRISAASTDERMPPAEFEKTLTSAEIELIGRWIDQGAPWSGHWAFTPPARPALPNVAGSTWPRTAVDYFILSRQQQQGLQPSPEADKARLLRRASLDLIGLPPTPEQLQAFLTDPSPDAYEKAIDRLLASPHFGERMAIDWLDWARYADTHGFHTDSHRDMWRWRDWVIAALNANKPFDRFTIEQLAGDLLPGATLDQQIASGFNRNHMINFEGGAIAEEYLTEYVVDRVVTTSTIWLGQTLQCCRCHDHKYDPYTQRDFYQLFAFFNNVPEDGLDGRSGNAAPFVASPTPVQQARLARLDERLTAMRSAIDARAAQTKLEQQQWEQNLQSGAAEISQPPADPAFYFPFDETAGETALDAANDRQAPIDGAPSWISGKFGGALVCDGDTHIPLGDAVHWERSDAFSISAWVFATTGDSMVLLAQGGRPESLRGLELSLADGRAALSLTSHVEGNRLTVVTELALPKSQWRHLAVTYDGSSTAAGVRIYFDGQAQQLQIQHDSLSQTIVTGDALYLGGSPQQQSLRGLLDEVRIYRRQLSPTDVALLAGADPIGQILAIPSADRTPQQEQSLREYYLSHYDQPYQDLVAQLRTLRALREQLSSEVPTTMVMRDMQPPRETFLLQGGDYRRQGEQVQPAAPAILPPLRDEWPRNRLGLACWIVDPQNPLTARVIVNRYWQKYFGVGLVETSEDFGVRGAPPSHPQLLDWLAVEFVESGWDVKHLQRLIVTSATYRQSSRTRNEPGGVTQQQFAQQHSLSSLPLAKDEHGHHSSSPLPFAKEDQGDHSSSPLPIAKENQGDHSSSPLPLAKEGQGDHSSSPRARVKEGQGDHSSSPRARVKEGQGNHPSSPLPLGGEGQGEGVQQSLLHRDPHNRLLARGPRSRLPAEVLRDNALAIGGLLNRQVGGVSVYPYQPAGLWNDVSFNPRDYSAQVYVPGHGADLYRRSLYTFWKRSSPPAALALFDAPNREVCTVRRSNTNTPLQALVLMNDPTYVEAARGLAQLVLARKNADIDQRIRFAFQRAVLRSPTPPEIEALRKIYVANLEDFQRDPTAAAGLLAVGDSTADASYDRCELAAWTTVASVILCLDETISN